MKIKKIKAYKELFKKYFENQSSSKILDNLLSLANIRRNEAAEKISNNFKYLSHKVKELPPKLGVEESKILEIIGKILESHREQQGRRLKIPTPDQMLSG